MYVNRIEETYARIDAIEVYLQNRKSENQPYRANYVIYTVKTFDFWNKNEYNKFNKHCNPLKKQRNHFNPIV